MTAPRLADAPGTAATLEAMLAAASIETLEYLARWFTPAALTAHRLAERDSLLVELGGRHMAASDVARAVETELRRYAATAWRADQHQDRPADARWLKHHRVLSLNRGAIPSKSTILRALSGTSKITRGR